MDYRIVIPSRGRVESASTAHKLLLNSIICIDERELSAYSARFPAPTLLTHPPLPSFGAIRNWIRRQFPDQPVVMIDDDFESLISVASTRLYRDPLVIAQVIENGVRLLTDLDAGILCWNRQAKPIGFAGHNPFGVVTYAGSALIVNSHRTYWSEEEGLVGRSDIDLTLKSLLHDRYILCDKRWYFQFAPVFSGTGGLQGMRTKQSNQADEAFLKSRWGRYVVLGKRDWITGRRPAATKTSINVVRKSPLAT